MYRLQPIQDEMIKRIGFRQTTHPQLPQLLPALTDAAAGIFVQDRHPLLNTNNLFMASENFDQWPYADWALPVLPDPGYALEAFVKHSGKIWISTIANNNDEPGVAPLASWTEINNFSDYLLRVLRNASQKTVEKLFQTKKVDRNTKTIFENIHLFDGSGNRNQLIIKQGRFVGFRVQLAKQKHLTMLLRKLGTQFNNPTGVFKLYVYHESKVAPILTRDIEHTIPNSFEWHNIDDIILPYVSADQDAGGVFYIGYYEDDLPMGVQAIRRNDYNWGKEPCNTCSSIGSDLLFYRKWSAFSRWTPIIVQNTKINAGPDRNKFENPDVAQLFDSNFGLNFHLNLKCDLTDFILDNIDILDEAYANQISYELLSSMAYTLRDNGDAKQLRDKAVFEITRKDEMGIAEQLEDSFKALGFDMSGFNSVCLPDNKKRGVRTGSML